MTTCPYCDQSYPAPTAAAVVVHLRACPGVTLVAQMAALVAAYDELLAELGVRG